MAAKKNPLSDKAYEMYKQGMKLVDIAAKLDIPPGTVRRWKSTHGWDGERSECIKKKKSERSEIISWVAIEHEYVTDIRKKPCSLEKLADKYSVSVKSVQQHCQDEEWVRKRIEYRKSIGQKALEKSSDKDADRIARLLQIADMATDKVEQALSELEQYVVRDKRKVRTVEYKDNTAIGKPTKEVVDEKENVRTEKGPVDRLGLSQVTSALKNIKELYALPVEMDRNKYQAEYERKRAEVKDNAGEEILQNMQTIADILKNPVANRRIEDFEEKADE